MKTLLAQKVGMTQMWDDKGRLIAATVIIAEPNKTVKEGEKTLLVVASTGKVNKAQAHLAKAVDTKAGIRVKTIEGDVAEEPINVALFNVGDVVKITGTTKGKGFAGTIKRHNFHRGPVSHGSDNVRRPGSIGAQRPQRVVKGKKMAGHMGAVQFTARGNKVLEVRPEENILVVAGAVPGPRRGYIVVQEQ